jgi:serine/threonine protein kinase
MGLQPGDRFGRYELVSRLGHGGMAETWRARLLAAAGITKPVLIKRILPEYGNDDAFISMFISEARISATLSHGNIAQVHDFGELDGEYFLAMEFVDGKPLDKIIKRAQRAGLGHLPTPLALFIAVEMCRGLHYAHTRVDDSGKGLGIVHRDISPDNVLISYEGQVKLVDFGIAKARMQRNFHTEPGMVKGKYLFFSPEQARGEDVDGRTDVWATGIVLYELLCGRLPVEGPEYAALPKLLCGAFPRPSVLRPELPAELESLLMKALSLKREERFESSHAFGDALNGYLYASTPRFSALSLSHFVQELFREDLGTEGRAVQVPTAFLEQLAQWRMPATGPTRAQAQHTPTQPLPPAETDTTPVQLAESTQVPPPRKRSRRGWWLLGLTATGALAMAGIHFRPDRLVTPGLQSWWQARVVAFQAVPAAPVPAPEVSTRPPPAPQPGGATDVTVPSKPPAPKPLEEEKPQEAKAVSSVDRRAAWRLAESGRDLLKQAKYAEAAETLERCLKIDYNHGECRRLYITALVDLGQRERAEEQMKQFLHTPPTERPSEPLSTPLDSYGTNR